MDYYVVELLTLIALAVVFFILALDEQEFPNDIVKYMLAAIFSGTTTGFVLIIGDATAVIVALGFSFLCLVSMFMVFVKGVAAFGRYSRGKWDNHRI